MSRRHGWIQALTIACGIGLAAVALTTRRKLKRRGAGTTVAATWQFGRIAVDAAVSSLAAGKSALDAVEDGVSAVELDTKGQYVVGYGGLPNAEGIVECDAAIMTDSNKFGAVVALQGIRTPVRVARRILDRCHCPHSVLAGAGALRYALSQGFVEQDMLTDQTRRDLAEWRQKQQQQPQQGTERKDERARTAGSSHDTIGLIVLDEHGNLAAGESTSGARDSVVTGFGASRLSW